MMFDIVFLGTSASAPSIYRGLSSAAVLADDMRFLVDAGEGTQRQILRSGIGFKRLNHILLTHPHLDHILGLGGLVSTFTRWESIDDLSIWGSRPTLERVHKLIYDIVLHGQPPPVPIYMHEIQPGIVYAGKKFSVNAFPVTHRGPGCVGYVFKEDDHRPFIAAKAEALGVPAGPERGRLVRGETITLADGRVITPEMVLAETEPGVKVVFTGDVARLDNIADVIEGADVLITEATFLQEDANIARDFGHITAHQAALTARELGVGTLLLTHVSRRYRERDVIAEARNTFPATYVVRDMDSYSVRRGKPIIKSTASFQNQEPET